MQSIRRCKIAGLQVSTVQLLRNESLSSIAKTALPLTTTESPSHIKMQSPNVEERRDSVFPESGDFEKIGVALDTQSLMLATGEIGGQGFHNQFQITPLNGELSMAKLRKACESVLERCAVLRVVFIQSGDALFQAVKPYSQGIQVTTDGQETSPAISIRTKLAHFHLFAGGNGSDSCSGLKLQIHHALYDAWSLGILFHELQAAYANEPISHSPDFLQWSSRTVASAEETEKDTTEYWKQLLSSSKMSFLAPKPVTLATGILNDATIRLEIPLESLSTCHGTPASAFKAAWALLLSHALGTDDVVFLEVNSNRYDSWAESDAVCGPCATLVPVRARLPDNTCLSTLVEMIQDQFVTSIPFQNIPTRSIVSRCTEWAPWSAFGSIVVFQNHRSLLETLDFDDGVKCRLSARGTSPELAQIWVMGVPTPETLAVEIAYSPKSIPPQQADWIGRTLKFILENLSTADLSKSAGELKANLETQPFGRSTLSDDVDSREVPCERPTCEPSDEARKAVSEAWDKVGLRSPEGQGDGTLSDFGADCVTAFLLSEQLKKGGFLVEVGEVVECPSQRMLASLIDAKILAGRRI